MYLGIMVATKTFLTNTNKQHNKDDSPCQTAEFTLMMIKLISAAVLFRCASSD